MASLLSTGLTSGDVDPGAPLISVSVQVIIPSDGISSTYETPYILIIILCTVIPGLIILSAIVINCYFKRKRQISVAVTSITSID